MVVQLVQQHLHFYPRSPCGERPADCCQKATARVISIHALLAESDCPSKKPGLLHALISIHALLAESDMLTKGDGRFAEISIHALLAESDKICHFSFAPFC